MFSDLVMDDKEMGLMKQFLDELPGHLIKILLNVVFALIVLWIGSMLIKWLSKFISKAFKRANVETGVIQFVSSLISVVLYILLALLIFNLFGVQATSIIALVGSAGVTVGLALQGSLSNLAGGVLILIVKPFVVGDYIMEDSKGNQGTVKEIKLFYTVLQTMDEKTIIIPNGTLANTSLTNVTHSPERRLDLEVGISYKSDMKKAKTILCEVAKQSSYVIASREVSAFVKELGESSVVMGLNVYVKNEDYLTAKFDLNEKIKEVLDANRIVIPYNQIDVHFDKTSKSDCH